MSVNKLDASEIEELKVSFRSITKHNDASKDDVIDYLKQRGFPITFSNKIFERMDLIVD